MRTAETTSNRLRSSCRRPMPGFLALAMLATLVAGSARAQVAVPADIVDKLAAYNPQTGDPVALLKAVVPRLATLYLNLPPGAEVQKGGPLSEVLSPTLLGKLDASPGSLPLVVYKKEDGRLPAAFIIARHKGVVPKVLGPGLLTRDASTRHPLVNQYIEIKKPTPVADAPWPAGTAHKAAGGFCSVDMPFGAGLFGLRQSYVFADWDVANLQNGIVLESFLDRPPPSRSGSASRPSRTRRARTASWRTTTTRPASTA